MPPKQPSNCCWGVQIQNKDTHDCTPRFSPGRRHFKSKFCAVCRKRVLVSETRVRALTKAQENLFYNTRAIGVWSTAPTTLGNGNYRIINNTAGCRPPSLVLFEDHPPDLPWHPMPNDWRSLDGLVELCVAKGTLVPSASIHARPLCAFAPSAPPLLCEVLVPSVPMRLKIDPKDQEEIHVLAKREDAQEESLDHPFLAALDTFGDEDEAGGTRYKDDDDAWVGGATAHKKALRMQRNRVSAATSRERKRKYICDLEQQVCDLTETVKTLREENSLLNFLNLQPAQHIMDDRSSPVSVNTTLLGECDVAFL